MDAKFPLFLLEQKTAWVLKISDRDALNRSLEPTDAEEYQAWDIEGVPIVLLVDGGGIVARRTAAAAEPEAVMRAIRTYASVMGVDAAVAGNAGDLVSAYESVRAAIDQKWRGLPWRKRNTSSFLTSRHERLAGSSGASKCE